MFQRFVVAGFVAAVAVGFLANAAQTMQAKRPVDIVMVDRVVVSAPLQIALFGGDRFLASNIETMRAGITGMDIGNINVEYLLRAQNTASELNPCQEDNYYVANALLTWSGGEKQAGEILTRATNCRFWDEMPPFYLGFNQYFIHRNFKEAQRNIELAASRSTIRGTSFAKLAIMIKAESLKNERLALEFLLQEMDKTRDLKLRKLLATRAERIEGLLQLREAQEIYESRFGRKLQSPGELVEAGVLAQFPKDPLNIGYRFHDGSFQLNEVSAP